MKIFTVLILCLSAMPALAAMSLDKIIVYLDDQPNAREDIVVTNPDTSPLYLQTEIYRVDNPGLPTEARTRVVDPKDFRLLVSPSRAVIPAGEEKRFRIMPLDRDLETEKVYRVTFKPVVGELQADKSALKILVAYQVLIFVQPEGGQYQLAIEKARDATSVVNRGNINIEVVEAEYCNDVQCKPLEMRGRIYPGASLPVDGAPDEGLLKLRLRGQEMTAVELPL